MTLSGKSQHFDYLPADRTAPFDAHIPDREGARGFIHKVNHAAIHGCLEIQAICAVEHDLPGFERKSRRFLGAIKDVDPEEMRILTVFLAGNDDRRMGILVLGVYPDPDNFPLVHGN